MKYRKPNKECYYNEARDFLDSLPAEFEILGPGEVAVKWPESASKKTLELLYQTYKNPYPIKFDRPIKYDEALSTVLHALAAIAPTRKRRRVSLWEAGGRIHVWGEHDSCGYPWRKVAGPIEIDD